MRQRLGQHFLTNRVAIKKIVESLEALPEEIIVEIGPGQGQITRELIERNPEAKIFLIELDEKLAESLAKEFEHKKNLRVIQGNVLDELPKLVSSLDKNKKYNLIGNLPYYLTGQLMREIGCLKNLPRLSVFTIQREVAERIASKEPDQNRLSAAVNFWANPKIVLTLKPRDFKPEPKVNSATIRLVKKPESAGEINAYEKALDCLFKQPRKNLINNLSMSGWSKPEAEEILKGVGLSKNSRAQDLSIAQIAEIGLALSENKN